MTIKTALSPQTRIFLWVQRCFGIEILFDRNERGIRLLEEATELAQALGCSKDQVIRTVDHVYSRPVGVPEQEVGGVGLTLLAVCCAIGKDHDTLIEREMLRVESKDPEHFRIRNEEKASAGIGSYKR